MTFIPAQVSEREPDGRWEDCTWATAVMFANAAEGYDRHPATQAEYEALRRASGDSMVGGSNMDDIVKGMDGRYGWHGTVYAHSLDAVYSMQIGDAGHIQGMMGRLSLHFRRWDPAFGGAHSMYAQRLPEGFWLKNPLAPSTYQGEFIAKTSLIVFANGLPSGRGMVTRVGSRANRFYAFFTAGAPFYVYLDTNSNGIFEAKRYSRAFPTSSGGFCTKPVKRHWRDEIGHDHVITCVKMLTGIYAGKFIGLPNTGVRVEVSES